MHDAIDLSPEAHAAVVSGAPVVALESSLVHRDRPFPDSLDTVLGAADAVRTAGAVPVVLAIMGGRIKVGLTEQELHAFARAANVVKVSRRDLATVLATRGDGATTVASSMVIASLAGLPLVVTGGMGGVHRGYESTLDASADLEELARTPVAVVCSGAKAILDLPRTLEYLETRGVPVIGYRTHRFPGYYAPTRLPVDHRADSAGEVARMMRMHWSLGLQGGLVIANPVAPETAVPADDLERWVEVAAREARDQGISGSDITPYMLRRMAEMSDGALARAGAGAVRTNAVAAAEIACAYAQQR